jgi:CBS domain-containing protein
MGELAPFTFLRTVPPFDGLPAERFAEAARALQITFHAAGTTLVRAGEAPLGALHVIRSGVVRILRERRTVQILERGEIFGYTSLLTGVASFDVHIDEDLLAYLVPADAFQALLSHGPFAAHFASGLSERLRRALERAAPPVFQLDLSREVGTLLRRAPVWVREDASVGDAARVMRDARVSSVLVSSVPPAIATDRDFRSRVLAERRGSSLPVMAVASRPLRTIEASAPLHAAWSILLDAGIHHLPVTRGGELVGLITATDLLRATAAGPASLVQGVERLASRGELAGHAERVAQVADALLAGGLDAPAVGEFSARLLDALLARLADWAVADLGPPPAAWAYVVLGPEGRMEQPLATERDHGVVVAPGADRAWFEALAASIDRDLEAAGFPGASGHASGAVASLDGWVDRVARAGSQPGVAGPLLDLRRAAGSLDLAPLETALGALASGSSFRRSLREDALSVSPPVKLGDRPVDLATSGLQPLVRLARAEGLSAGLAARTTLARLASAEAAGRLSAQRHASVAEAFRFLSGLHLRQALRQLAGGRPPSSTVEPATLDPTERVRLKDAFGAVRGWQERVAGRKEEG